MPKAYNELIKIRLHFSRDKLWNKNSKSEYYRRAGIFRFLLSRRYISWRQVTPIRSVLSLAILPLSPLSLIQCPLLSSLQISIGPCASRCCPAAFLCTWMLCSVVLVRLIKYFSKTLPTPPPLPYSCLYPPTNYFLFDESQLYVLGGRTGSCVQMQQYFQFFAFHHITMVTSSIIKSHVCTMSARARESELNQPRPSNTGLEVEKALRSEEH